VEWYRREKPRNSRKTRPSASTNPTWTDPGANPKLRGERPAVNRLSHLNKLLNFGHKCNGSRRIRSFQNFLLIFCLHEAKV
jgi:hypothetical protein